MNPILATDSYKVSHWKQYPPHTEHVESYFESRGGKWDHVKVFGTQYVLNNLLARTPSLLDLAEAEGLCQQHFGSEVLNIAGWQHIIELGYWPVEIMGVPEGMIVPTRSVLLTVRNTDPTVPWLTNYLETRLAQLWYPMTVATLSAACKSIISKYLVLTGSPETIDFKLHDFGYRGSTSEESSAIGGAAHLVNFKGTDTLSAVNLLRDYYHCGMAGYSIPAAEHSTISSWMRDGQRTEGEVAAYLNMLTSYPTGLVAVVSDTDDIYQACDVLWGQILHDEVMSRNGTLVIRPDSGHPPEVIIKCLRILESRFGVSYNQKGYRLLDPHVRLIQGDGCDIQMIEQVLQVMEINGWSADNVAFGMGGGLLQNVNRDTLKFAFKCCGVQIGGQYHPVHKQPVGDKSKHSFPGPLSALPGYDRLVTVYRDGQFLVDDTLDMIRERAQ